MQQFRIVLALVAALLAAPLALAKPAFAAIPADDWTICTRAIEAVEGGKRLPLKLLDAVSLVESGRWDAARQEKFAWPWTVYAEGRGRYFATKREAVAAVRRMRKRGIESIDVGCMQVNLFYHPTAFASLGEAFDPHANAAYAARFLGELRRTTRSWTRAVAHYHSSERARGVPYWHRVRKAWDIAVRRHYRERREAHIRAYKARRAQRLAARQALLRR
ncbi:MAG: hypothetical protein ACTSQV_05760 [Alphaproteobacteria bacterium]